MNSYKDYNQISFSLDALRGIAMLLIVSYHLWGFTKGYQDFHSLLDLAKSGGLKEVIEGFLYTVCLLGEQGVHIFLIISGFGLTASWLRQKNRAISLQSFWQRRIGRIIPMFWLSVALSIGLWWINPDWVPYGGGIWQGTWGKTLLLLGSTLTTLRNFIPDYFFTINGAWWYVGLAIQLYFAFPFLIRLGQHWGWNILLGCSLLTSLIFRLSIWLLPLNASLTNIWIRGAFFPSRLFEFVLGLVLAIAIFSPDQLNSNLVQLPKLILRRRWLPINLLIFFVGFLAHHSTPNNIGFGRVFSDVLMAWGELGSLIQLILILEAVPAIGQSIVRGLKLIGKYSYGIYLTHMNIFIILWLAMNSIVNNYWIRFGFVVSGSVLIGMSFDGLYQWGTNQLRSQRHNSV